MRQSYSQSSGNIRDTEIATYHAAAGMDEVAASYFERLQAAGWKKGAASDSGKADVNRLQMVEWTTTSREAELRFYTVKAGGTDVRIRIFTYKTVAATAIGAATPGGGAAPPLSTVVTVPDVTGRSVTEADSLLKDAGLKAQTNPGKTMADLQTPGNVAEQSPLPGQKVKRDSTVTLTPWSSQIAVYDVVGVPLAYAQDLLKYRRFRPQVGPAKQDLLDVGSRPKDGLVAEEHPAAGQAVALDSTVTLIPWVSQVIVPDVSGQPLAQATSQLQAHHLKYRTDPPKLDQVQPGASPKDGIVAVQNPAAGQTVALDSIVNLIAWISQARVPDFNDVPLAQAESQLTALQLKFEVGPVLMSHAASGANDGLVGKQSPHPGAWLNFGATVTLNAWASAGEVPDVTGQPLAEAESLLGAQQFQYQVGPAKPDTNNTRPSAKDGMVAEQSPAAHQAAARGSVVTLTPWATAVHLGHVGGLPLAEAEDQVTQHGLKYQVAPAKIIPAGTPDSLDGKVAEQAPLPGATVAAGSTVILTPWLGHVPVPDVTGQTLAQAESMLGAKKFQYEIGPARPDTSATGPSPKAGLVAAQSPVAGKEALRGSVVTLNPWGTSVRLGSVVDLPLADAEAHLTQRGFKYQVAPGKLIPASHPAGAQAGHVAEQQPGPGLSLAQGDTVILTPWVAPVTVPDVKHWTLGQAESALTGLGLQFQLGAEMNTPMANADTLVGAQSPAAGQAVAAGSVVTLQVYHYQASSNSPGHP